MEQSLQKRSDIDFMRRSLPGVLFYGFMWPMMTWTTGFYEQAPTFNTIFSALFAFTSLIRVIHAYATNHMYNRFYGLWRAVLFTMPLIQGVILSTLLVIMISHEPYQKMAIIVLLLVTGIISGSAISLSPKPFFTQLYIALLILPGLITSFLTPEFHFLVPLSILLWLYFSFSTQRFYNDYRTAFTTELHLKDNQKKLQTDPLTQIYNRQYFDIVLDLQWNLMARSHSQLSILFLDLDHFKSINDNYGHLAGDRALCHAADLFSKHARRQTDVCARYGGEEFAVILPHTNLEDALVVAESIRHDLEGSPAHYGTHTIPLGVSIGVNCVVPNNQEHITEFLEHADKALYEAKSRGRNRVISYQSMVDEGIELITNGACEPDSNNPRSLQ